ncbi:hypothetical protein [Sphingomonas sp. BK580]|uniref:hypothetical protein n=1 Tax=Sphingomonas sp. BK580 TaxID=2586972 RepID=UPI001616D489|nr:hypothetical protein [Sphingomonas sp. BK580]MBB3694452.1 hypothetical protein [Sphingomonas sp. BK580]
MMLRPAAPPSDQDAALVPLIADQRVRRLPRRCRAAAAVATGACLVAPWRGLLLAAAVVAALAGALFYLTDRVERHRAAALAARLAELPGTAITYRWRRAGPGAIAIAEGPLVWLVDRTTACQTVRLTDEQIVGVRARRGWRGWSVALLYRLDPHEAARRSLICFGRDRAAADAFVAHLARR